MAQTILLKRSALQGKVPDTGSLQLGEVAINTYDGKAYIKRSGSVESIQEFILTNTLNTGSINLLGSQSITGSLNVSNGITGSLFGTASFAISASHAPNSSTSSYSLSSSYAQTSSYADNFTVAGTLTAQTIVAQIITSSTEYITGSTIFGSSLTNTHQFTGSVTITGSLAVNGVDYISTSASIDSRILSNSSSIGILSSSFLNTSASLSASISLLSGSYLASSASFDSRILANSSSIGILSGSFLSFSSSFNTGSFSGLFTGSFIGDGSGLYNIPASGIVGLNLSQIASGSATASISPVSGFRVNTNTTITGSLTVTSFISGSQFNGIPINKGKGDFIDNVAIGEGALSVNTTGYSNTAVGFNVLPANQDGSINTALGYSALSSNTGGSFNTALGYGALSSNTSGGRNTAVGFNAGVGLSTPLVSGFNNIFLGSRSEGEAANESNRTWIGNADTATTWLGGELLLGTRTSTGGIFRATIVGNTRISGSLITTGSIISTLGFTGSLQGTASFASNALSASYAFNATSASYALSASHAPSALTASYAISASQAINSNNAVSASYSNVATSASYAFNTTSASYATTASFAQNLDPSITASFAISASQAINSNNTISASYASDATSASYANNATSASYAFAATSASYAFNATSASYALSASHAPSALTASYAISASQAISASYANVATSASYAQTASFASDFTVAGTLTAQTIVAQVITSSTEYVTGSTIFGSQLSNTHQFTGSVTVTGSLAVNNSTVITTNQTSSMSVLSASYSNNSTSASYALSSSYAYNADFLDGKNSSEFATTGSNIFIGDQIVTGSLKTSGSNTLVGNTVLTGSLNITGSTFQIGNNSLLGNTILSGSIIISGSENPSTPTIKILGDTQHNGVVIFNPISRSIDNSISASYIYVSGSTNDLYFTQNGAGFANTTRLRWLEGNLYTGLLHGGILSTVTGSTTFNLSSGSGIIVNLNASLSTDPFPTVQYINWDNFTNQSLTYLTSSIQTFLGIDSSGQILQQTTPWNDGQYNTSISVGTVLHQNQTTTNGSISYPNVAYGWKQRSYDFVKAFGPLKLSGYYLTPSGSATGSLIVSSGTAWADGRNYQTDPNNPSYIIDQGTNVSKIFRYYQSGSGFVQDTNGGIGYLGIDPGNYNPNGSGSIVGVSPSTPWTNQRAFYYPNSVTKAIVVYYGTAAYASETEAINNLPYEQFIETPNTQQNAIYLGTITIKYNGSLQNPNDGKILPGGIFRNVGGSGGGGSVVTSTLAGLSDVQLSGPTNYQPLVYNTTLAKWINASFISGTLYGNAQTATSASQALTASYANVATSASYAFNATTSSYANDATSASYAFIATSASYALSASHAPSALTSSYAISASQAITASYANNATSASYANNTTSASYAFNATSSSYANIATSASYANDATSASYAFNATSASYALSASHAPSALTASYAISASQAVSASYAFNATSASYANNATSASYAFNTTSASYAAAATSASYANISTSGSYAATSSYADNFTVAGTLTAQTINVQTITSSIDYVTGSTIFGSQLSNTHQFTGSVSITGSLAVNNSNVILTNQTSSMTVLSASYATTASFAQNIHPSVTASYAISASQAITASYALNSSPFPYTGSAIITGSLTVIGNQTITGSLAVGTVFPSTTSNENTLTVGLPSSGGAGEGGQILLQASGGLYTSASMIDTYQNRFRILRGTNAGSDAEPFSLNLHSGQLTVNRYTGSGAFPGTAAANLAVDSSGNVITIATGTVMSASYAVSASFASTATSASFASTAASASYSLTTTSASFASNALTASYANVATSASYSNVATSASYAINTTSASYALQATTASYVNPLIQNVLLTGSLTSTANIQANKFVFTNGVINENTNAQRMFATSGDILYLYTGTNGLYINNQANTTTVAQFSNTGQLTIGGPGNDQNIVFGGSNSTLDWAGTGAKIQYSVGALQFSSVGTINNMVLQMNGGALFNYGITGSLLGTASYASQALTASYSNVTVSASYARVATTASYSNNFVVSGSLLVTGSIKSYLISASIINAENQQITVQTISGSVYSNLSLDPNYASLHTQDGATSNVFNLYKTRATLDSGLEAPSFTGSLVGNADTATSASYALTASYASNVPVTSSYAMSASQAVTASFALNAGGGSGAGFPFSGSAVITGSLFVTQSFVNFTSASYVLANVTGSLFGTASYATFALSASNAPGFTTNMTQAVAAATWSFNHNLNTRNPIVQVYDTNYQQIIPNEIVGINAFLTEVRFTYAQAGYAVASNGGGLYVTGSTPRLVQTVAATTWSFAHNLGTKYPGYEVYDSNDNVIIPAGIKSIDINNAEIYFAFPATGVAIANFSGISGSFDNAISASYATSASYALIASTASFATTTLSSSYAVTSSYSDNLTVKSTLTLDSTLTDYATVNSSIVGTNNLFAKVTGSYTSAFMRYTVRNGTNARTGEMMVVWNGANIEYTDVSTNDIGNTSAVTMSAALAGSDIQLNAVTSTSGWSIKSLATFM